MQWASGPLSEGVSTGAHRCSASRAARSSAPCPTHSAWLPRVRRVRCPGPALSLPGSFQRVLRVPAGVRGTLGGSDCPRDLSAPWTVAGDLVRETGRPRSAGAAATALWPPRRHARATSCGAGSCGAASCGAGPCTLLWGQALCITSQALA